MKLFKVDSNNFYNPFIKTMNQKAVCNFFKGETKVKEIKRLKIYDSLRIGSETITRQK